jgi:CHAT domain-containing protein
MASENAADFLGACLFAFAEGASEEHRHLLTSTAPRLGLTGEDQATRLFVSACKAILDEPLPEGFPVLAHPRQCAFLVWLSGILFDGEPSTQAKVLHDLGVYYVAAGEHPLFSRYALRHALAIRLHGDHSWSLTIDSLTQLAVAFDAGGRSQRAMRLLDLACRLSDVQVVEPRCRDACLRLAATACAWAGDLRAAIDRLDAADSLSEAVYGASPLRVDIAWTIAICMRAFHGADERTDLVFVMSQALLDLQKGLVPSERFTDVDRLQHGLARTMHGNLAVLSNRLTVRLANEVPNLPLSVEDRCILFNNYGNALLHAGWHTRAISQFVEAARVADGDCSHADQRNADYQRMHALGGIGFAHFNLARQEDTPAGRLAAWNRAAAAFEAAEKARRRVGSRAWFEGRIWVCAGLVDANLGRLEKAWNNFARALVAGVANWSTGSDPTDLGAFFNPDSDIHEKLTEGLEQLHANHAAVLFGKTAVHAVHRESLPSVDGPLSYQYVKMRSGVHRTLVRCLTAVGRHNEAEQAFALLKEDAWGIYARRTEVPIEVEAAVAFTQAEAVGIERAGLTGVVATLAANADADEAAVDALAAVLARLDGAIGAEVAARKAPREDRSSRALRATLVFADARVRYVVSPVSTSIAVETRHGIAVEHVDVSFSELSKLAFALRQAGRQASLTTSDSVVDAARQLEVFLIGPIRRFLLGVEHLWIEADSPLEGVPFAALFDGERYLFEDFSVAYLNAAGHDREALVASAAEASVTVFACSELPGARLPGAAAEAAAIEAATTRRGRGVRVESFRHEHCTTGRLIDRLKLQGQRYSAIHLATHAEFNATSDALSVLALSDGALSIRRLRRELEPTGLDVGVFVLSACGTARQDLDVEGFSATLLRAGAGAVVSSLWETLDDGAPAFFEAFYAACDDFDSPRRVAQALQRAQRAVHGAQSGTAGVKLGHPAEWAPYVVTSSRIA